MKFHSSHVRKRTVFSRPNTVARFRALHADKRRHIPVNHPPLLRTHLDLDGVLKSLPLLLSPGLGLGPHDTTTPVSGSVLVLLEVTVLDGGAELGELALVLGANLGECDNGGGLRSC